MKKINKSTDGRKVRLARRSKRRLLVYTGTCKNSFPTEVKFLLKWETGSNGDI